jgi:tRNA (guanine-N(7)-)-methyltransferase
VHLKSFIKRSRPLSKAKKALLEGTLPKFEIKLDTVATLISKYEVINLEIGFGKGDFLAALSLAPIGYISPRIREDDEGGRAPANKQPLNIGCEPYIEGIANLLKLIKANDIKNIRIWPDDARLLLESLPDRSLDTVYILFPDPWPKRKQQKRRLISPQFVTLLSKKLKPNGTVFLATDHHDYATWSWHHFEPTFLREDLSHSSSSLFGLTSYHKKNLEGKDIKVFKFQLKA